MMSVCKLEGKIIIPCKELAYLISIDDKFEKASFVTMNNPNEDIAQLITIKAKGQKNAVALKYCPFCGNKVKGF